MGGFSSKPPQLDEAQYFASPPLELENEIMGQTKSWTLYSEAIEPLKIKLNPKKSPYTVGRSSSNTVVVSSSLASKQHIKIVWQEEFQRWALVDLQSSGGTKVHYGGKYKKYINTEEGQEIPLQSCCGIQLGKEMLCLKSDAMDCSMVLECTEGTYKGQTWHITGNKVSVGRSSSNTIALAKNEIVSGQHFEIARRVGWFALLDQNSKNGTLLSNMKLQDDALYFLWPGAKIKVGFKVKGCSFEPDMNTFVVRMKYRN